MNPSARSFRAGQPADQPGVLFWNIGDFTVSRKGRAVSPRTKLPFRHAKRGEDGIPFIRYLVERIGDDPQRRERVYTFIHDWEHIIDGSYEPPSVKRVAEFSRLPLSTEYQRLEEYRNVFPTEEDPTRLVNEIWDGIEEQQPANGMPMLWDRVLVVPSKE
jgi:hypothetical protein